jgi:hypothetical protein
MGFKGLMLIPPASGGHNNMSMFSALARRRYKRTLSLCFSVPRSEMEVCSLLDAPATLPSGKQPLVPSGWETGWAQAAVASFSSGIEPDKSSPAIPVHTNIL